MRKRQMPGTGLALLLAMGAPASAGPIVPGPADPPQASGASASSYGLNLAPLPRWNALTDGLVTVVAQAAGAGTGATGAGAATGTTSTGNTAGTAVGAGPQGATGAANPGGAPGVGTPGTTPATGQSPTMPGNEGGTVSSPDTGTMNGMNGQANGMNGQDNGSQPNGLGNTTQTAGPQGSLPTNTGQSQFTLADATRAALASSSDLITAQRNVEIDRKRADEAASAARPNISASGTATRYDQATKIGFGGGPPIEVQKSHSEILSLNLGQRFDFTGQIRAATNQARLQSLADQFVLTQIRNARILRAQSIYFNLLRAQHQVEVAQATLNSAQEQLATAQKLNLAGVGQKIDVLRAATQVAQNQQQVVAAQNNLEIARSSFNDLVGRPLDAPMQVEDVPGVTVGTDVTTAPTIVGAPTTLPTPFAVPPSALAGIDVNRSLQTALASRPEILAGQVNVRVSELGITLARAGDLPTFALNAAGNYYPTTSFQFPRQRTAQISATVTIPIYDGGLTRDRVDEARLRTANAQTQLASERSDVALDVRQSYLNLITAARQIDAANAALQQAIATRQLAQIRYAGQVGLFLEVTDAQAALVQAQNNQVDAVYNYLVARAQFANAQGTPQTQ